MIQTSETDNDDILGPLNRLVNIAFYTNIPLVLAYLVVGILSNSLAIMSCAIDYGLSMVVHLFNFYSMRAIRKPNAIKYPFGTGKLENFSAFLYGALVLPTSFYILYLSASRILSPPQAISFTIAQIPMIPALARSLYLFLYSRNLKKQSDSPMVESYYVNYKVSTFFDVGIMLAIVTAMVMANYGHSAIAYYVDPVVSLFLALYMLYTGVKLTVGNFRILIDLPLPEEEQLKIMSVLAREYENYENVGSIYTRRSGRRRFLEIELFLHENMALRDTMRLQSRMREHLESHFDDIRFSLIPRLQPDRGNEDGKAGAAAACHAVRAA